MLAVAGLGLDDAIGEILPLEVFPPSTGQGALGIQIRSGEQPLREILGRTGDPAVHAQVTAERALLPALHGGCSVPVGAYAQSPPGGLLQLTGQVTSLDGTRRVSAVMTDPAGNPNRLGPAQAAGLID